MGRVLTYQAIARTFERVFGVPARDIQPDLTQEALENWDSMSHIELVLALERELGVRFTTTEFPELTSVAGILAVLRTKGLADEG